MSNSNKLTKCISDEDWVKVFYNNKLYIIHEEHKAELEKFLYEHRTTIKYLQRHYGDISELVK